MKKPNDEENKAFAAVVVFITMLAIAGVVLNYLIIKYQ
jgi:hypothetical protein